MSGVSKSRIKSKWVIGGIAFGIILVLTFLFRGFVRQEIVLPALYLGWVLSLVINSLDQSLIWIGLVMIAVILVIRALIRLSEALPGSQIARSKEQPSGRVSLWRHEISMAGRINYLNQDFNSKMRQLTLAVLSSEYRKTPGEVESLIREGELQVPRPVYQVLMQKSQPTTPENDGRVRKLFRLLKPGARDSARQPPRGSSTSLQELIDSIDELMEGKNDRTDD